VPGKKKREKFFEDQLKKQNLRECMTLAKKPESSAAPEGPSEKRTKSALKKECRKELKKGYFKRRGQKFPEDLHVIGGLLWQGPEGRGTADYSKMCQQNPQNSEPPANEDMGF